MSRANIDRLASAQVAGMSLQQTARAAGVSKSTVQRLLQKIEVQQLIEEERGRQHTAESTLWTSLRSEAMTELQQLLTSEDEKVRLRAVQTVFHCGERFDVLHELGRRQAQITELLLQHTAADEEDVQWPAE